MTQQAEIVIESIRRTWPRMMTRDNEVNQLVSKLKVADHATIGELIALVKKLNSLHPDFQASVAFNLDDQAEPCAYIEYRTAWAVFV